MDDQNPINDSIPYQSDYALAKLTAGEIVLGSFVGIDEQGRALVSFFGNGSQVSMPAISTVDIAAGNVGRQVALLFKNGDVSSPIIIGFIHNPLDNILNNTVQESPLSNDIKDQGEMTVLEQKSDEKNGVEDMLVDGQRVVIEGKQEVVLKCGEASITLTKAGKILIRGKYLLNRSSGVNRIMGGSVQVN